jgi:hypothetical protein
MLLPALTFPPSQSSPAEGEGVLTSPYREGHRGGGRK